MVRGMTLRDMEELMTSRQVVELSVVRSEGKWWAKAWIGDDPRSRRAWGETIEAAVLAAVQAGAS